MASDQERVPFPYRTRKDYLLAFMANVANTSATTVTGDQQGSRGSRPGKPSAGISGYDLAEQTNHNMRAIGKFIASAADPGSDSYTWSVRRVVNVFIDRIHRDLPKKDLLKALRSHETRHNYGCPPDEVEERWEAFLCELELRLRGGSDLERLCAWVEYETRFRIHPLADGSGRLATALTAWIMLRNEKRMPMYMYWQRSEMHEKLRAGFEGFEAYYLRKCFPERTGGTGTSPDVPFSKRGASDAAVA